MFCTWSAVAYILVFNNYQIQITKQLTAEKLILEKKKKIFNQKKKTIINYAKKRTCTATYVMKHSWTLYCTVTMFENCWQYIDTVPAWWRHFYYTYSMLCTWSAVAYNLYLIVIKFKSQNTDSWKINFGKEKKIFNQKKKNNYQLCKKRTCTATYVLK